MVRHVKTVPTQAFQIWTREDMRELGWPQPPVNLSGFVEPFDTWADMSHLIPEESWSDQVKAIAYFCSVLPDTAAGCRHRAVSRGTARAGALQRRPVSSTGRRRLWPQRRRQDGGFRWDVLASEDRGRGAKGTMRRRRFDTSTGRPTSTPRIAMSCRCPGSIGYRVSPLDMTFDNLTIAGDWTATGLDTGCIESAVMSGLLAAHAISHGSRPWRRSSGTTIHREHVQIVVLCLADDRHDFD